MKFQRKKTVLALAHATGAAALIAGASAMAQDQPAPSPESRIKIEVVGSSIKRSLEDQALPVQVFTKEDIARLGVQNIEQLIQKITASASMGAINGATSAGTETFGQSSVSLRGLGSRRTLVLLDGQRVAPFAQELTGLGGGVDINAIPVSMIERVEVLTDGASSVYGSDALAGVINFVLRRNYTGVTVGYEYDWPTRSGGGTTNNFWVNAGYGDINKDKFNFTLGYQNRRESTLSAADREFSKSGNVPPFFANGATPSGRVEGVWVPGSSLHDNSASSSNPFGISTQGYGNPGADSPGCAAMLMFDVGSKPRAGTGHNCNFDSAPFVSLFPKVDMQSVAGTFDFQLTPEARLYVTGLWTENKITEAIQPAPVRAGFLATDTFFEGSGVDPELLIFPGNPNYPHAWLQSHGLGAMDGQPLGVSNRAFAAGGRTEFYKNTQQQLVAGVKGTWLKNWDYDVNGLYSESKSDGSVTGGFFSQLNFVKAWNTIGNTAGSYVDPWAVAGVQNPTLAAALASANYNGPTSTAKETLSEIKAKTSGDIYDLPAGPLTMAVGLLYRYEKYDLTVADVLGTGDIAGFGAPIVPQSGNRGVTSGFVEFAIPATKELNFSVSGRFDHYTDLKTDDTPLTGKISGTWQPWKWGMFRGGYGTGFRAPSLGELHSPLVLGTSEQFIDPLFPDVGVQQVNAFTGGNPNLKPEKSQQATFGFVWTPMPNLTGRIDWWGIKIKDFIIAPAALGLVNAARAGGFLFNPGEVTFAPDGEIDTVNEQLQNAAKATFSGLDLSTDWRMPSAWGTWGIDYNGTYYFKADLKTLVDTEKNVATLVNSNTLVPLILPINGGVIPRYKQTVTLSWLYGPWGATLSNNYITAYETGPNQVDGAPHFVPSFNTWDAQVSFSGIKYVQLVLGARNLFDKNPNLFIPTSNQFQYGYDPSLYDPRGRVVYARGIVSF
jgi:iron complex outermembrane recepter protein